MKENLSSHEIRENFIKFFIKNKHLQIKNSSVIPKNDPTLLFINSGMAAIKGYFIGQEKPPQPELCNIQTCIRTIDIDDIGDAHHLTSFQMLGSWSIGGYFKKKAICLAFDFLTNWLKIPKDRLYASVFSGDPSLGLSTDSESKQHWIEAGIDESHIVTLGKEDNFWGPPAETGPCGPCTEVFYDTGFGTKYEPGGHFDTKRYIEIWNAGVFMMFNKNSDGTFDNLAFKSVDTGAGLERLTMAFNGFESVYETDLLKPIKKFIKNLFSRPSAGNEKIFETNIRILTDHLRTCAIILAAKIAPSNVGRGYVPRKMIRKCVVVANKTARLCGLSEVPSLGPIVSFILENFSDIYEDFKTCKDFVIEEFEKERLRFDELLENGLVKLEETKQKKRISGETAFALVSTFGLPFEIIKDFAHENFLELDEDEFKKYLEHHRDISKSVIGEEKEKIEEISDEINDINATEFTGYEHMSDFSKIVKIISESGDIIDECRAGSKVYFVLESTCAYAKSGGQESDSGILESGEFEAKINSVFKRNGVFFHHCEVLSGEIKCGDAVKVKIDKERRKALCRAHSAVHLLHSILKQVFGTRVNQQGSKVTPDKLRFDFNLEKVLERRDCQAIEELVNDKIMENIKRETKIMDQIEAIRSGATALFSDKYDDVVRVVCFWEQCRELCGGMHVDYTGEISIFLITSIESIGKGIKRITALTGKEALKLAQESVVKVDLASRMLGTSSCCFLEILSERLKATINSKKYSKKLNEGDFKFVSSNPPVTFAITEHIIANCELLKFAEKIKGVVLVYIRNKNGTVSLTCAPCLGFDASKILKSSLSGAKGKCGGNNINASGSAEGVSPEELINLVKGSIKNYKSNLNI
ncbi:MAG: alanine--tRNA ligase [Oscillospiraceae bacterium]|jgi:alanyl-tRNA synthetase|nr:alanine--tRNA ligase [Oscillospiraceae bacterium]